MATLGHIFIILVLLMSMIFLMLGIGELNNPDLFDNTEDTGKLKKEVDETRDVVGKTSIFNPLVNNSNSKEKSKINRNNFTD